MKTKDWNNKAVELKAEAFETVNNCLVLAPHPDDESLGCGGLIALLREKGKEVFVLFITDGSLSHPNSVKYPAAKLAAVRREEAIEALRVLNVPESNVFFLNKKDGFLPAEGEPGFEQNSTQLHVITALLRPDFILVPYSKDPHRDHRATAQMLKHVAQKNHLSFRVLQYVIWLHERGEESDLPNENALRFADVTRYLPQKEKAIRQHLSQTTRLIDDDPQGFILSPEVLSHFITAKEYYIDQPL